MSKVVYKMHASIIIIVVVSGGTDGIGKAYMIELARRGLRKFVVIGRNETKLSEIKTYLGCIHLYALVVWVNQVLECHLSWFFHWFRWTTNCSFLTVCYRYSPRHPLLRRLRRKNSSLMRLPSQLQPFFPSLPNLNENLITFAWSCQKTTLSYAKPMN